MTVDEYRHQCGNGPPRWVQFLKAKWGGYFWLPCPVCHRKFGGHEWKFETNRIFSIPDEPWRGEGVCSMECVLIYETQSP